MSSIPKIDASGKVKFATFQANESTTSPHVYLNDYEYDSFSPSFKGDPISKSLGKGMNGKNAKRFLTRIMIAMGSLALLMENTQCSKPDPYQVNHYYWAIQNQQTIVEQSDNTDALLARLIELMIENNHLIQEGNEQAAEFYQASLEYYNQAITLLAEHGVTFQEILQEVQNNGQSLQDLVQGNDDLKALVQMLVNKVTDVDGHIVQFGEANNQLLSHILAIIMHWAHDNNAVNQQIVDYLVQLIEQVGGIGEQQAQYYNQILEAMNHMSAQMQLQLTQILQAIQSFDANVQNGHMQLLALLNSMQGDLQYLQGMLLNFIQYAHEIGGNIEAMFNQLMANFNTFAQQIQMQLAQIFAYMQTVHQEDREMFLAILAQLQNIHNTQQEMQEQQQANFLHMMELIQHLIYGQGDILNAIQGLNANFLAMMGDALAQLDHIGANQVTQITQLAQIYEAMQNGNATLNQILDFIMNDLNLGTTVDLSVIESFLAQILASQNTMLNDMNANAQFIRQMAVLLQAKMQEVINNQGTMINGQEIMNEWLEAIFNRIPEILNNCNCEDCCAQLVEILLIIDQHIQELDWNHEGIIDEGLLGGKGKQLMNILSQMLDEIEGNKDAKKIDKLYNDAKEIISELEAKKTEVMEQRKAEAIERQKDEAKARQKDAAMQRLVELKNGNR